MFQNTYIQDSDFAKRVFRLALPSTIQALLNVSVNALNNLLAGHYFGEVEISALSQTASVFAIYEVITYGFASSCGILVAQYWGKKDREKIEKIISIAIKLEVLLGLIFSAVMLLFSHSVMSIMTKDSNVLLLGAEYLKVSSPIYLLFGVCNALYSSFSSLEMVNHVFCGNSICSLSNLALSYILIPKYGVIGAAVSALVSRAISFAFALAVLFRNRKISYEANYLLTKDQLLTNDFLRVAYPVMGHELIWSVGNNMPQILMGRISTIATSSYSIAISLCQLLSIVQSGLGSAALTVVGQNIGTGEKKRAEKSARTFVLYTLIASIVSTLLLIIIHPLYLSFYDVSPAVIENAKMMMKVLMIQTFFTGFDSVVLVNVLRAGGMGKVGFYTDIVVMWMIAIPLGWLGALKWNLIPPFVALLVKLDMPLKSLVGLYVVLKTDWIHNLTRDADTDPA
ncbi:MAG: MATE family efflux transporter [Oscillospiraceae bacterium]|nr:MATE family efflux transporter [Oscillospiraceae bacterium]MBR0452118.1 MATE family efflux transporter [Oscillospiraceae bacterium]